jgi:hypothetical protein
MLLTNFFTQYTRGKYLMYSKENTQSIQGCTIESGEPRDTHHQLGWGAEQWGLELLVGETTKGAH